MRFNKVKLTSISLFAFLMLAVWMTNGRENKTKFVVLRLPCTTSIDVNTSTGVNPVDAYVCQGDKITWNANGHAFTVFFKNSQCPFTGGCQNINDQHPTSNPVAQNPNLTVFTYGILVDGQVFDPHVVGGGGNDEIIRR
jgi:hypothetical protein